jgi:hypothetical protein
MTIIIISSQKLIQASILPITAGKHEHIAS